MNLFLHGHYPQCRCKKWEEGTCASRSDHLRLQWNSHNSVAEIKAAQGKQQSSKRLKAKSKFSSKF